MRQGVLAPIRRRWQLIVDVLLQLLLAGLFLVSGVATATTGAAVVFGGTPMPTWVPASLSALQVLPLAARRRAPALVLTVVGLATTAHVLIGMSRSVGYLPVLVAIATAAERPSRAIRWGLCPAVTAAIALASLPRRGPVEGTLLAMVAFTIAWLVGMERGNQSRQRAALAEERTRLRLEQRLGRQLHDTVAHTITVMLVQAEALLVTDPLTPAQRDRIDRVLEAGRGSLAEIRRVLGALDDRAQAASTGRLVRRLDELKGAGLAVPSNILEVLADLPEPVRGVCLRLTGETATNALRHGGPGTRFDITVEFKTEAIILYALSRPRTGTRTKPSSRGGGYGLRSLADEVEAIGGTLTHGPADDGGWSVVATFPLAT